MGDLCVEIFKVLSENTVITMSFRQSAYLAQSPLTLVHDTESMKGLGLWLSLAFCFPSWLYLGVGDPYLVAWNGHSKI